MGTLYIVSTPIGNLEDITIRAIKTLFSVDGIACEDTRRTHTLLDEYLRRIKNKELRIKGLETLEKPILFSYYDEVEEKKIPQLIQLLLDGKTIALASDAGTPLISDPGYRLVRECIRRSIPIISIPGPTAAIAALSVSGLPTHSFLFLGYPPEKQGQRRKLLQSVFQSFELLEHKPTTIFYCAPHKLTQTLLDMKEVLGDIDIVIARELTKVHEEVIRGNISEILKNTSLHSPKGEFTLLFTLSG